MDARNAAFFWTRVHRPQASPTSCWLWNGSTDRDGHGSVSINGTTMRAHRVAYQLVHGPIDDQVIIRHTCDVPACCNPDHLIAGTHGDNVADRMSRGRHAYGERNGRAKLTEDNVREIKHLLACGYSRTRVADEYRVDRRTIALIDEGVNWKHVTYDPSVS